MPRFQDTLAKLTAKDKSVVPPINLTELGTGPPLMDSHNPAVKIMLKGRDLHGCIIDGVSSVNVINEATCSLSRPLYYDSKHRAPTQCYLADHGCAQQISNSIGSTT